MISLVSPVYRSEGTIRILAEECAKAMKEIGQDYELLLICDGSPDDSWSVCEQVAKEDPKVVAVNLSRNFGQHNAITAGLNLAKGEQIVVLDCDMQDRPDQIPKLYRKSQEGYDVVFARRATRQDSFIKKFFSKFFYQILGYLTETEQDPAIANFGIYHRKVIDAVNSLSDNHRFFPIFVRWVGFKITALDVEHGKREIGESSYNFKALITLALFTIINFSNKPLRLTVKAGLGISALAFLAALYTIVAYLRGTITETGWASLTVMIIFSLGITVTLLGMLGLYIGAIFDNTRSRPQFIIDEIVQQNGSLD